jgi:hypothetical protein
MKNRIFAASYERGIQLIAAGCPLDFPEALPGHSAAQHKPFRAEQLRGYAESRVYPISPLQTKYLIGLRLGTDRPSGTIITEWSFVPPSPNQLINWDYEPQDIIPEGQREAYAGLLESRLMDVLNDHRLLRRGYPVAGLLCGYSSQPIPESGEGFVYGKVILVDDIGNKVALPIALTVIRPPTRAGRWSQARKSLRSRDKLFSKSHSIN